jgi:hypothetical protein
VNVQLHHMQAVLNGELEGAQRVLRCQGAGAAMADGTEPSSPGWCRLFHPSTLNDLRFGSGAL